MVAKAGERCTYLSIELDTGIFQLCHQLPCQLIHDVSVDNAKLLTFVAASLKSLSKLSLTISILLGTFVVSSPIRQPPPPIWHLRFYKSDVPLFFITSPTFNMASTAPWWFLILSKND